MISPLIEAKHNMLFENIYKMHRVHVRITWSTGKVIRLIARKDKLLDDILRLQKSYSEYYKEPYVIRHIIVLEEFSKERLLR